MKAKAFQSLKTCGSYVVTATDPVFSAVFCRQSVRLSCSCFGGSAFVDSARPWSQPPQLRVKVRGYSLNRFLRPVSIGVVELRGARRWPRHARKKIFI